jgi:hypothetical protein
MKFGIANLHYSYAKFNSDICHLNISASAYDDKIIFLNYKAPSANIRSIKDSSY